MASIVDTERYLQLATSPICAAMAWHSAADGGLCLAAPGPWPLNGMAAMYLLMGIFHLPAWLRLIPRHRPARPETGMTAITKETRQ